MAAVIDTGIMARRVVVVDWLVTALFAVLAIILAGIIIAMLSVLIAALLASKRTLGLGSQCGSLFVSDDICLRQDVNVDWIRSNTRNKLNR